MEDGIYTPEGEEDAPCEYGYTLGGNVDTNAAVKRLIEDSLSAVRNTGNKMMRRKTKRYEYTIVAEPQSENNAALCFERTMRHIFFAKGKKKGIYTVAYSPILKFIQTNYIIVIRIKYINNNAF